MYSAQSSSLIESLETRQLFSVFPDASILLRLTGSNGDDTFTVAITPDHTAVDLGINGRHKQYPLGVIHRVEIYARNGNDNVLVDETNGPIRCQTWIDGGLGNDTLHGGSGSDTIVGGDGKDKIDGGGGDDQLNGGNDNDVLYGSGGNDYLIGDFGRDRMYGGDGNDLFDWTRGIDVIYGGSGSDVLMTDPFLKTSPTCNWVDKSADDQKDDATYYKGYSFETIGDVTIDWPS